MYLKAIGQALKAVLIIAGLILHGYMLYSIASNPNPELLLLVP